MNKNPAQSCNTYFVPNPNGTERGQIHIPGRMALAALCVLCLIVAAQSPARAYYTQETRLLMRIKEVAPGFGLALERTIFQRGFARMDSRDATERIYDWIEHNQYPHLAHFLEALDDDDVATLLELFKQDVTVGSTPELPLFEDLHDMGQYTVLALPFKGEFFVLRGNDEPPNHLPAGARRYAWDFLIMKKKLPYSGDGSANKQHLAWGAEILSPAPGRLVTAVQDFEDHAPGSPAPEDQANRLVIDHGTGESSTIRHIQQGSISAAKDKSVARGALLARTGDSGDSELPLLHFQLDKSKGAVTSPIQARFAVYFARDESDVSFRLVVSGIPATGQYIIDVNSYLGL